MELENVADSKCLATSIIHKNNKSKCRSSVAPLPLALGKTHFKFGMAEKLQYELGMAKHLSELGWTKQLF